MMKSSQQKVKPALGILLLSLLALSCAQQQQQGVQLPDQPTAYIGRAACASCHPAQAALWEGSHHDLAMQEANEETVLGDFNGTQFSHAGVTSRFFRRDGKFMVRTDGPDGRLTDYEIAYTFGVEPLQQYLIEFPGGRYQALSICWDARPASQGGQRWFHLYPDEDISHDDELHWTGPNQNWNYMCAECHSTKLEKNYQLEGDRFRTSWSEIDVSCEACHGPGWQHAAWAKEQGGQAAGRGGSMGLAVKLGEEDAVQWVFDSQTGTAHRQAPPQSRAEIEACARCHSRRAALSTEYAHGKPLMDTHRPALLEETLYFADGQIRDEVYVYGSFVQSKMHSQGVTCSDCHDPHKQASLPVRKGSAEGRPRCRSCRPAERITGKDACVTLGSGENDAGF